MKVWLSIPGGGKEVFLVEKIALVPLDHSLHNGIILDDLWIWETNNTNACTNQDDRFTVLIFLVVEIDKCK
jgi:hypothetical protein